MKPQISLLSRTGVRSMLRTNAIAVCTVASEVLGPRTTSQSCMTVTGWKKCMLQQRSGWPLKSASRLMAMVLELLARIASLLACLPSASKHASLGVEVFEHGFDDKVCVSHRRGELFGL